MIFLIDHNIEGQALMLFGSLSAGGWLDILPIRFVSFDEVQLPIESSDACGGLRAWFGDLPKKSR